MILRILFTLLFALTSHLSLAQTSTRVAPGIYVQEEDGSPAARFRRLKYGNGSLTDNGDGSVSIAGGGGSGDITDVFSCPTGDCHDITVETGDGLHFSDDVSLSFGNGDDVTINYASGLDSLVFSNGANNMVLDSSGNLGIGTTSPSGLLHVQDGSYDMYSNGIYLEMTHNTAGVSKRIRFTPGTAPVTPGTTQGATIFATESGGVRELSIGDKDGVKYFTTIVAGAGAGNVGVGDASPDFMLEVAGSLGLQEQAAADADEAGTGQVWVKSDTPNTLYFTDDAGTDWLLNSTSGDVTSGSNITDNALVRGDGGAKGIQQSGIIIADTTDNMSEVGNITFDEGAVTISIEDSTSGNGGALTINSGNSTDSSPGGAITIQAGDSGGVGDGGAVLIAGGDDMTPGVVTIRGGEGESGANVIVRGGDESSGGAGGNVFIYGGDDGGAGTEGDVFLAHNGTGIQGNVGIGTTTAGEKLAVTGNISVTGTVDGKDIAINAGMINENEVVTGSWDFGGAGSIEIVNAAAPTVNAAGEIAVDTTEDQLVYYGAAKRVLPYEKVACTTIENLAAADDGLPFLQPNDDLTLIDAWGTCVGTCTTEADVTFDIQRSGSGNTFAVTGTVTTEDIVTGDSKTTLSGNTDVAALDLVRFHVNNSVDPETDTYILCTGLTVDAK